MGVYLFHNEHKNLLDDTIWWDFMYKHLYWQYKQLQPRVYVYERVWRVFYYCSCYLGPLPLVADWKQGRGSSYNPSKCIPAATGAKNCKRFSLLTTSFLSEPAVKDRSSHWYTAAPLSFCRKWKHCLLDWRKCSQDWEVSWLQIIFMQLGAYVRLEMVNTCLKVVVSNKEIYTKILHLSVFLLFLPSMY